MKSFHKMLGLALLCGSLTLVGCGGGGGGGSSSNNADSAPVASAQLPELELEVDGAPEDSTPVIDTELIQPIEEVALLPEDLDNAQNPSAIAANPEPATVALGALGVVFLASRRYRRKA